MLGPGQCRKALSHHDLVRKDGPIGVGLVVQGLGIPVGHRETGGIGKNLAPLLVGE